MRVTLTPSHAARPHFKARWPLATPLVDGAGLPGRLKATQGLLRGTGSRWEEGKVPQETVPALTLSPGGRPHSGPSRVLPSPSRPASVLPAPPARCSCASLRRHRERPDRPPRPQRRRPFRSPAATAGAARASRAPEARQLSFQPAELGGGVNWGYAVQSESNTRGFGGASAAPPLSWELRPTATFDEGSRVVRACLGQSGVAEPRPPKVAAIPDPLKV